MQPPVEVFQTLKPFAALELYRFFLAISDLLLLQPLSLFLGEILLLHAIRIGGPPACSGNWSSQISRIKLWRIIWGKTFTIWHGRWEERCYWPWWRRCFGWNRRGNDWRLKTNIFAYKLSKKEDNNAEENEAGHTDFVRTALPIHWRSTWADSSHLG